MEIHAFCNEEFLNQLSENSTIDLVENDSFHEQIAKVKLFDLLRNGVKIHCHIKNTDELKNPFIKSIIKKETSTPLSENEIAVLRNNPAEFITRNGSNNSLFLLDDNETNNLKSLENKFGFHCINSNNYNALFKESIQLFERNVDRTNWNFAKEYLKPHNSLLIVDPYLFTKNGFPPILDFLRSILPTDLKSKYHLSLIAYKNIPGINISEAIECLENLLSTSVTRFYLDIHLFNKASEENRNPQYPGPEDFHDRYLISNNACIFSGRGLDYIKEKKMNYEGTWIVFKPFSKITLEKESAFFTKVIEKKMRGFKKWIKKSDYPVSHNPLINSYKDL